MSQYNEKFNEALQLAQKGRSQQSMKLFEQISGRQRQDYCSVVNFGVMCMQQGKLQQAKQAFRQATRIDNYQYIGYYNLFVLCCHQLQNEKNQAKSDYLNLYRNKTTIKKAKQTLKYLYLAISCLYSQLAQFQKDPKLCTKALIYCQQNSMAYLNRAILYEKDGKIKLSQNDYSSAIYYAPQNSIFYMSRAEFYWKNGKITQSNEDLKNYWSLKNKQNSRILQKNFRQLKCKQISQQEATLFENTLSQKSLQLEGLLTKLRNNTLKKQQNNWQINIPTSPRNNPIKQQIKSDIKVDQFQPYQQDSKQISKNQSQSNSFVDQSSKNISQQIQKLQKQIRLERGKLQESEQSQSKDKQISTEQILLNSQIQRKSEQIEQMKRLQADVLSNKRSQRSEGRVSEKIVSVQQVENYSKIRFQIVSAQFFDAQNKQQSRIFISYGSQKQQTQYSKTNIWRQKFDFDIQHHLHKNFQSALDSSGEVQQDYNEKKLNGQILLQLQMKSKSIWSSKKIIGRGNVNIQQMGANKCILSNDKQKTGIVYFKLKLQ